MANTFESIIAATSGQLFCAAATCKKSTAEHNSPAAGVGLERASATTFSTPGI
jgi:hypothetical protein